MAAHTSHPMALGSPELLGIIPRRISTPNIPFLQITDVDSEKPGNSENSMQMTPDSPSLYSRISKGILKSDSSSDHSTNSGLSTGGGSSSKKVSVSIDRDVVKPITKWRRICKCFIGLKVTKKSKNPTSQSKSGEDDKLAPKQGAVVLRNRSQSLHPGADPFEVVCPPEDGYSLHTLYRKMEKIDSPMIIAILDSEGRAFGAVLSCALRVSEHFYGSCDSFLFRCGPPLEVFKWQPNGNCYFIHSEESFLRVGAGKGNCGLWLDDNLYHGRTEECATFDSPPLVPELDFEVQAVEVWTFGQI